MMNMVSFERSTLPSPHPHAITCGYGCGIARYAVWEWKFVNYTVKPLL